MVNSGVSIIHGKLGSAFHVMMIHVDDSELKDDNQMLWVIHSIDTTKRMIAKYPDVFEYVTDTHGFKHAMRHDRIASMLGLEGGQYIYNSAAALRTFYDLGVRYMTVSRKSLMSQCGMNAYNVGYWGSYS